MAQVTIQRRDTQPMYVWSYRSSSEDPHGAALPGPGRHERVHEVASSRVVYSLVAGPGVDEGAVTA